MKNYEYIKKTARSSEDAPSHWPKGVVPITMNGLSLLGLDEDNQPYWDGKPVIIKKKIRLAKWELAASLLADFGVLCGGIGQLITAIKPYVMP